MHEWRGFVRLWRPLNGIPTRTAWLDSSRAAARTWCLFICAFKFDSLASPGCSRAILRSFFSVSAVFFVSTEKTNPFTKSRKTLWSTSCAVVIIVVVSRILPLLFLPFVSSLWATKIPQLICFCLLLGTANAPKTPRHTRLSTKMYMDFFFS